MNLRQAAQGQPCSMCLTQDETVVLHHIRLGAGGMGLKPPDHHGITLCFKCHTYVHGKGINDYQALLLAYLRQIDRWLADEVMVIH